MVIKKMSNANKVWRRDDDEPQRKKRRVMIGDTGKDGERTLIISGAAAKKPSSTPPPPCASAVADNNISHLDGMKKGSYVIVWGDDNKLYKAKVQKIIHDAFDTRIRVQYEGRKTTALLSRDMIYSVCDTSRRQLRGHDPIALAIKSVAYNAAKQSSSSSSPKNSISTNIGPYPLKPVYQVGTHVYAAYWPPHDIDREREPSWYPGIISSSHFNGTEKKSIGESSSDDGSGSGERARLYNINFDDGDSITNVPEQYVFLTEEYLVCAQEGRRKKDGLPWLGDVINIVDDNSSDDWARYVGWYMVTIDGVQRSFALLIDALRAYDSSVLRSKGWAKTKLSDLNLPEEWTEMLSKKLGKEEEGDKEVQEKTGKEVGTQTSELTTTKKDRSSARSCLPVDWYNALSARPRGESIEYYHFSSTVNNNQLKLAKSHSMNESDDDDDDFSVDMVDGIEIRSKSNSHEERNKSISDWKCFKCKVGNCQKWTNVKGGFCESHVGSAKTSNTKTICGKDKFDGAGTDESSGGERNSDSGMEFDCYDVGMNGAEMSTTFEESQPKNLLPTIQGIQSSREEPQSTPTLVAPIAEIMNEEQSTVVVAPLIHNSAIEHKHTCTGAAATTKNSPTVKKWKSKSMPPQIATTSMHEKQPTAKPIRVILMNSKLTTSSCHTAEMSDGGIEESDDGKVIDLTILEEQPAADVIDLTISEEQPAADPAASPPHHPPPSKSGKPTRNSEGYLMVWTCDVCRVAQLPTFEEAVEHEKICTGLPPSSPLPLQLPNICEEQSTAGVPNVGFINDEQSTALALPIVGVESTHQIQVLPKKKRPVETSIMDYTYTDYSQLEKKIDVVGVSTKSSSYFPAKLHAILSDSNNQHILCWQPHGRSWKIVDKDLLSSIILPKYFEHVSENSFKTMLGQWGFKPLLSPGPDYKSYYHEWFLRDCPDLTKQIQRLINPGIRLPNLADEPNLYEISQKDAVAMSMVDNQAPEDTEVEMDTGGTANDCSQGHNNIQNPATEVAPPPPKDGDMARPIVLPALQPIPKRAISPVQGAPLAAAIVAPLDNLAAPGIPAIVAAENVVDQLCKNCPKLLLQRKQYKKVFQVWLEDRKKNWSTKQEHQALSLDKAQKETNDYIKVWTCDVCRVVQLPTFEEAVEHEKICTSLPPSYSSLPQTKAAHLEHEKSEKESSSSVTTSEPSNQSLGGVNLCDIFPIPQTQQLSSNAAVAVANKVAQDTEGGDVIEQTIEQEPVKEVPVAAINPRQVTVTDTVGDRESYTGVMPGVRGVPLGVEAATTAASSGCLERKEPNRLISSDNGNKFGYKHASEPVQHSSPHNTTKMNSSNDDNDDVVNMALEDNVGAVENPESIHQAEESSLLCKSDDKSSVDAKATAKTKYTALGIGDVLVTIVEHESV